MSVYSFLPLSSFSSYPLYLLSLHLFYLLTSARPSVLLFFLSCPPLPPSCPSLVGKLCTPAPLRVPVRPVVSLTLRFKLPHSPHTPPVFLFLPPLILLSFLSSSSSSTTLFPEELLPIISAELEGTKRGRDGEGEKEGEGNNLNLGLVPAVHYVSTKNPSCPGFCLFHILFLPSSPQKTEMGRDRRGRGRETRREWGGGKGIGVEGRGRNGTASEKERLRVVSGKV